MKLRDMKMIVTGGGGGIGAHVAIRLAEAGAQVCVCDLTADRLTKLAETGTTLPGTIHTQVCNITDEAAFTDFIMWSYEQMHGLNGLVNNAGILRDGLLVKKDRHTGNVTTMSTEEWQRVIDVNLTSATLAVRDVVATMLRQNQSSGVIINMSSLARYGNRGQSNYVAAKAALAANTVTWAREFGRYGIRVAAIAPGMIETPMTRGMNTKARDTLIAKVPVGRIGEPEDIWKTVQFIIECDYFNGRTIDVDGGLTM